MNGRFDVRNFGAAGDGRTLDTAAIQRAIDAATNAGGGVVDLSRGCHLSGTIILKSNVDLHVHAGATLLASPNRGDYSAAHNSRWDIGFKHERVAAEHFIYARDASNIAITGRGKIDGNGRAFFKPALPGTNHHDVPGWRPGQMITFYECKDVLMRDITIIDSPYWTIWPHGCDRVRITGITILNDRMGPNADGVNPDCCRDVIISDCRFDTGDDCIAVRSDGYRLGQPDRPCENIVVTNCIMTTCCCGVRVGYCGDGPIRNCTFSNLTMVNTRTGINMLVPRVQKPEDGFVFQHGPLIENISFSNIIMDERTRIAIYLWIGDEARAPGGIRNINISDITATTTRACYIGGAKHLPIESVRIRNMQLNVTGEMDDRFATVPEPYPIFDDWMVRGIPHGLYGRYVNDLSLRDVRVTWRGANGAWKNAVRLEHARDHVISDFVGEGFGGQPALGV